MDTTKTKTKQQKSISWQKSGIPTISSGNPTTIMLVQEAVKVLERVVNKAWVHVTIFDKNQQH